MFLNGELYLNPWARTGALNPSLQEEKSRKHTFSSTSGPATAAATTQLQLLVPTNYKTAGCWQKSNNKLKHQTL